MLRVLHVVKSGNKQVRPGLVAGRFQGRHQYGGGCVVGAYDAGLASLYPDAVDEVHVFRIAAIFMLQVEGQAVFLNGILYSQAAYFDRVGRAGACIGNRFFCIRRR